jgi:uncharacterized protein YyaL (SSP411 family)
VLNGDFVSIKVDREERPDIDELYMAYTQALTRHGGWPMSVWMTPGTPFHAAFTFPKRSSFNCSGHRGPLEEQPESHHQRASGARGFFAEWSSGPPPAEAQRGTIDRSATQLAKYFDPHGGMGGGRRFRRAAWIYCSGYRHAGDADLFEAMDVTLDHMAARIYDHVGRASAATAPMANGLCRTSRRCCMTRRWSVRST